MVLVVLVGVIILVRDLIVIAVDLVLLVIVATTLTSNLVALILLQTFLMLTVSDKKRNHVNGVQARTGIAIIVVAKSKPDEIHCLEIAVVASIEVVCVSILVVVSIVVVVSVLVVAISMILKCTASSVLDVH